MDHTLVMAKGFAYRATQDGQIIVESSDKMWSTRGGMANYSSMLASSTP